MSKTGSQWREWLPRRWVIQRFICLGATSDDGLNAKGAYLLQWTLIQWLKENGIKWYDLGGIDPEGNPGVYSFKRGLSGTDVSSINPTCGMQQCCLFCGRQGKPSGATCSA